MRWARVLGGFLAFCCVAFEGSAQDVIATRAGLVNYSEGTVLLDNRPLVPRGGTFASIPEGSTLQTETGRAEILLTPGVFLRIDENSAIRMVSGELSKTKVEFLRGAAILDSNEAQPGSQPVTLVYKQFQIHFNKNGVYRVDSEPAVFETYTGEAEITSDDAKPVKIDESKQFFFTIATVTNKYGDGAVDLFSEWARNRAQTIDADQRAAAQSLADPSAIDPNLIGPGAMTPSLAGGPINNGPFYPQYSVPYSGPWFGSGVYGGALGFADNFGPLGWPPNLLWGNPLIVVYVLPHWRNGGVPRNGIPGVPRRIGYPVPGPLRSGLYSHSYAMRPLPMYHPMPARAVSPLRVPASRGMAIPPRMSAPAAPRPAFTHPAMRR